ncbi:Os03g0173150 [Oryza sativa Japonica Group]|uniref:Os03g0173150 protein n=1 Tax=Oryza sativa subsp. japonica TaxID=39947 RepID=A0A0P0VTX3_ORYSJ|nr:Os03g0173150 [Oryza sativa Japonica Group]
MREISGAYASHSASLGLPAPPSLASPPLSRRRHLLSRELPHPRHRLSPADLARAASSLPSISLALSSPSDLLPLFVFLDVDAGFVPVVVADAEGDARAARWWRRWWWRRLASSLSLLGALPPHLCRPPPSPPPDPMMGAVEKAYAGNPVFVGVEEDAV